MPCERVSGVSGHNHRGLHDTVGVTALFGDERLRPPNLHNREVKRNVAELLPPITRSRHTPAREL